MNAHDLEVNEKSHGRHGREALDAPFEADGTPNGAGVTVPDHSTATDIVETAITRPARPGVSPSQRPNPSVRSG